MADPQDLTKTQRRERARRRSVAYLQEHVSNGSRLPFQDMLATALSKAPTGKDWRTLSKDDPGKYVQAVSRLAEMAGYTNSSVAVHATVDVTAIVAEMVERFGPERAVAMAEVVGLPRQVVEAAAIRVEGTSNGGGPTADRPESTTNGADEPEIVVLDGAAEPEP